MSLVLIPRERDFPMIARRWEVHAGECVGKSIFDVARVSLPVGGKMPHTSPV
jgi:hypothetical protein